MDDVKAWYQSKTIWGALIAILASLLQAAGISLNAAAQGEIADALVAVCGAIGGLIAIYGRLEANRRVGPPK